MKIVLMLSYAIFIAFPVNIFLLILFPIFMMTDFISKDYRWKITLRIHEIEEAHFYSCFKEELEEGICIDYPPNLPDKPRTTFNILRYFINAPLNSKVLIKFFENCDEEDE